ncbi:MAG: collagen binding domain-containing protein [[Clostridium] scindens]
MTVTAGQIASPAFASSESTGPLANPGYVNVSPKGRFQLMKTDEKGNIITGSPATFQLYGPFETEQNINGLTEIPQEWMQKLVKKADGSAYEMSTSNGMATSIALEEGYYVLKETKEPDGYAIIENGMAQVKVAANTSDTELEVQNTPKIKVRFLKEGKVGNVTVTDSAQLTGAEFEIWDSLTGGTCLYGGEEGNPKGTLGTKLVTAVDGTGNPYTEYAQLAPGTYYYIETKAPEGFQTPDGNTRTEFTVSRGEETKDITVVNTADYGRIKLVKKDSHSGQTLAGAKFQIFMDSACKQPVTDSKGNPVVLTSADDGIAYSPLLPKGTYWLKEIEAPKGHVMSKTVIQADVGENQETEIEVSNDPEVSLKIQKTDSVTGNVITEDTASFRLKAQDDGGVWQWVQADPAVTTDGVVVFTGLVPGKAYQIYEFKSPAGYVPADLANGTLVTVVTLPSIKEDGYGEGLIYSEVVKNVPLGTYKIYKTTDFDGNGANVPLGGAVFELYQCGDTPDAAADCVEKNLVSAQTTDAGGNAQWTGLLPGEYWLKEITAEGHQLMAENPRRVSVKPGQNTEGYPDLEQVDEIQNQAKDGKVAIAKADANEPGARLANVTFSIYKEEAGVTDYSGKEVIATLTTNQDGNAISGWLEPGAYVLVEQELPDELSSYERDTTPHAFTITADKSLYLELIVTGDVSGNEYAYVVSSGEHNYTVSYNLGGRSEVVETGVIQQGDSFEFVADSFYVDANGNEWQLAASENASRTVAYGAENYSFNYVAYDPGPVSASVAFVDEYGNVLKRQSKSIAYNQGKGQVTFDLPGELEVNGRKYEIDDTLTGSLTISYMDDVLDYEISYRSVSQQEEGPYTVTVEYWEVDAAGKPVTFLGNTYFTQDTNADSDYVFNAPQTIRIRNQEAGSETYYKVVSNATITQAPKGEERLYTVGYQKYAEEEPYEWSIRLIDAETGKILKEEVKMVDAGTTEAYKAATEIEADGVKYLLDSKMEREYTHTYNQGSRIQNIYYHQESSELPASYDLTIQYMSVSDNTMLYTDKTAVTAEAGSAQVASPQNYEANGKQYVRLSGQSDVVNHDFYSAQRTYTIYYRDVNDEQNVDTVVTQEDVVTSENLVDDGTQTATVLTNATTGTTVTLNDEGVPLANTQTDDEDDNGLVTSEDEDVPLANIDGSKGGILGAAASHPVTTGVILAALLAMIGIAGYFFWKKKNEKEDAAGDGSN